MGTSDLPNTPAASGTDAYAAVLDHLLSPGARHAAITKNLCRWSNYKSWVNSMRRSWPLDDGRREGKALEQAGTPQAPNAWASQFQR